MVRIHSGVPTPLKSVSWLGLKSLDSICCLSKDSKPSYQGSSHIPKKLAAALRKRVHNRYTEGERTEPICTVGARVSDAFNLLTKES